jgi:protocatechuate 3,4-dioxygenase beta subunit
MKVIAALLVAVVATVAVGAQAPARDAATPASAQTNGTGTVSGTVTDETRQPVRRATVTASGPSQVSVSAITDNAGRFSIGGLAAGRFTITAKKAGSPQVSYGANRPNRPGAGVLLADGQQVTGLTLTLARGGVLAGTVFDERGDPMPGVPIMAWEVRATLAGDRTLDFPSMGGESVTTDDRGMYRIFGLPPGEYTVGTSWSYSGSVSARTPTDAEIRAAFLAASERATTVARPTPTAGPLASPLSGYVPIFHPSATDPLVAQTVELGAGEERGGLDIRMQRQPTPTLEAKVLGPDGPVGRAEFRLARRSRVEALNSSRVGWTQPDGQVVLGTLAPGDYTLRVDARATPSNSIGFAPPADNPTTLWAIADVTLTSAPVTVTLQLQPAMTLGGRVLFDAATVPVPTDLSAARVSLAPPADSAAVGTGPAKVSADGTFTLSGVTPGRFRVTGNVPAAGGAGASLWTLKSVVLDGIDVTDRLVEIGPGETRSLVVTFTDRIAELTGTITNAAGKPLTDYFVIVLPADRQYWMRPSRRIMNTRPDVGGRFAFRGLPPGDYRIAVTTDLIPDDLADGTALQQLLLQSTPLTIAPGERKVFDIRTGQ